MGIIGRFLRKAGQHTLHPHIHQVFHTMLLLLILLIRRSDNDRIPVLARHIIDTADYGRIEMSDNIRHDNADNTGRILQQTKGKRVRTVIPFLGKRLHTFPHLGTNLVTVVQRTGYGRNGNTQLLRQVFQ